MLIGDAKGMSRLMTNAITLVLVLLILAMIVLDATVLHMDLPLRAAKATAELIEWLTFWN